MNYVYGAASCILFSVLTGCSTIQNNFEPSIEDSA